MSHVPRRPATAGQSSLEYLLLIGGGVLIATIILLIVLQSLPAGNDIVEGHLNGYYNQVDLPGSGGGGPPDVVPPAFAHFSVKGKYQRTEVAFLANDPSPSSNPVNYTVIYGTNALAVNAVQLTGAVNSFDQLPGGVSYVNGFHNTTQSYATSTPFVQLSLTNGTNYYYRVRACDAASNCVANGVASLATPTTPTITIASLGSPQTVFDYSLAAGSGGGCLKTSNNWDLPDTVAHAIQNPFVPGQIILFAGSSPNNYVLRGTNFNNLQRDCSSPMHVATNIMFPNATDSSSFNNQEWVSSVYTDGTSIHAFIHNEFHDANPAHAPPPNDAAHPCNGQPFAGNPCWYNGLIHATSSNGITFTQTNTAADVIAAPPLQWNYLAMNNDPYGYMAPSNILHLPDGYYYTIFAAFMSVGTPGQAGTCIMRTNNLNSNSSWRAYNTATGQYDLTVFSPYTTPGQSPCSGLPSAGQLHGSLVYSTYFASEGFGPYVLVGSDYTNDPNNGNLLTCGVWFRYSSDLVNWSPIQLLKQVGLPFSPCGSFTNGTAYHSLIDHTDTDPNFQNVGATPYLYYTQFLTNLPGAQPNRDLVRQQMQFSVTWP